MSTLTPFLSYWFWPRLGGGLQYSDPKVIALLTVCGLFVVVSIALRFWRKKLSNPITKKLSSSWPTAAMTFGIIGLILIISRVEDIQFIEMRFMWVLWALALAIYVVFQWFSFMRRHYTVVQKQKVIDVRDRYMPTKKRR
ncbi:MAG: hypothetical protein KBD00_04915 [Candidatus Peribacteraceae bacterium]|nr:hypothetical protein [Candidatus Peribacteraceae bacterium]